MVVSNAALEKNLIQRVCVGDIPARSANHFPDKVAIIDEGQRFTYRKFNDLVNCLGNALLQLGARHQDVVAVMCPNTWEMLVSYFACAKAGLVAMPVNLGLKAHEVAYCFHDSQAKILIADGAFAEMMSRVIPELPHLQHVIWTRVEGELPAVGKTSHRMETLLSSGQSREVETLIDDRDIVQLLYTSGTTSNPKGVLTSHVAVTIAALSSALQNKTDHTHVTLSVLPLFHCAMLNAGAIPLLLVGGTLVLVKKFDPLRVAELIEREQVTHVGLLPMMYQAMLDHPATRSRVFSSVKMARYAMTPLPEKTLHELKKMFPNADLLLGSGQTEFTPPTTYQRPEHQFVKSASWGVATPMVQIEIMDEEGNLLPRGQIGEIVYRGPHVMEGYLNLPEQTAESFRYGWFHSGDLAWMDEEGVVWFADRKKDMIKTGGENVASIEVERLLMGHPAVQEAAVIGLPHPYWGEAVTAVVMRKPGEEVTEEALIAYAKEHLAGFKVPKRVIFTDELPKTGTGKIQKHLLRQRFQNLYHDT